MLEYSASDEKSTGFMEILDVKSVAERVGFEPTEPVRVHLISSQALSTTQPSLRR
jgi:hypothetical protein